MSTTKLPEDDAEAVLQTLEDSGIFDELRKQLMDQISQNEELHKHTHDAILKSRHLPLPTEDKRTLSAAYELIRKELTGKILEKMVETVWVEMDKKDSQLWKDFEAHTHQALCTVQELREQEDGASEHQQL